MGTGPTYTDAQRDAIATAVLDQGMTAGQAVLKLNAGLLAPNPPMPLSTAQEIAKQARRDRERANHDPRQDVRAIYDELHALVLKQLAKLKADDKAGKLKLYDLEKLTIAATRLEALASGIAKNMTTKPVKQTKTQPTPEANSNDPQDDVAAMHAAMNTT